MNYNDASLIITPNGVKAGKLYALKGADLDVVRATDGSYVGSNGVIQYALPNVPRLDYSNGTCPSILVEPQRTNVALNSETLATQSVTVTAQAYTLSFYGSGTVALSGTHTASVVGLGTARKTYTFTPTAGTLTLTITGTCTKGQLEAGSFATSYIPTTSAIVTRNADVISKTGISSLIGQTEGTLFVEFNLNDSFGNDLIIASIETYYTNSIQIRYNKSNNTLGGQFFNGSSYIGILNTTAYTSGTAKVAYVYKSGAFKLFINGTLISTSTNTYSAQTFTSLGINALWNELLTDKAVIKSVQVYKNALIDSECINLTTL